MIVKLLISLLALSITLSIIIAPIVLLVYFIAKPTKKQKTTPNYNPEWTRVEERQKWVHESTLANEIHATQRGPSFEEWKAARKDPKDETTNEKIKCTLIIPDNIKPLIEDRKREELKKAMDLQPPKPEPVIEKKESAYESAYEATPLLTPNESRNYHALKAAADKKGYIINSKVRLADIVKPKSGKDYMSNFGRIKSKHVDFVVCDRNMHVKAIIELDDRSHDRADRQARDKFVDEILTATGYKIIHTRYITPDILDNI